MTSHQIAVWLRHIATKRAVDSDDYDFLTELADMYEKPADV